MSEHVWVQENIAAHLAGGLTPDEGERLEKHLAECAACASLAEEARSLDRRLRPLLVAGNPGPDFEDRLIHSLHSRPVRRNAIRWTGKYKLILGSAAAVLLAILGGIVSELMNADVLKSPGTANVPLAQEADREGRTNYGDIPGGTILAYEGPQSADALAQELRKQPLILDVSAGKPHWGAFQQLGGMNDNQRIDWSQLGPGSDGERSGEIANRFPDGTDQTILFDKRSVDKYRIGVDPPVGHRAIGVKVNPESIAGGWNSLPNSRVDIMLNTRKGDDKQSASQIILQNALVLGIDDKEKRDENGRPMAGSNVILSLSPEDALKIDVARNMGSINLLLRPEGDDKRISTRKVTGEDVTNNQGKDADPNGTPSPPIDLSGVDLDHDSAAAKLQRFADAGGETKALADRIATTYHHGWSHLPEAKNNLGRVDGAEGEKAENITRKMQSLDNTASDSQAFRGAGEELRVEATPRIKINGTDFTSASKVQFGSATAGQSSPGVKWKELKEVVKTENGMEVKSRLVPETVCKAVDETVFKNISKSVHEANSELVWKSTNDSQLPPISRPKLEWAAERVEERIDATKMDDRTSVLPPIPPALPAPTGGAPPAADPSPTTPEAQPGNNPSKPQEKANLPAGANPAPKEPDPKAGGAENQPPILSIPAPPPGPGPLPSSGPASPAPESPAKKEPPAVEPPVPVPPPALPVAPRKIIRSGEIEFEVDSFDGSYAAVMRLIAATKGSFMATSNSEKLPNGKTRGSIMVRIPPELLDNFVLDLRKELARIGELKNQRIGSEDVTKHYSDLDSQLRAARAMEERLLAMIKDGKGQIKDLLMAEKELGVWRTKIEEIEGELRFYNNLVSLSTLTIKLYEKDIRVAASIIESEQVQAGIEKEDVEKAYQDALKAIADAKGRVSDSKLEQRGAGQFYATLNFEVTPDEAGPMRDRLKQLGTMARLQIDRLQQTPDGGPPAKDGKIERGNTKFKVSIYNLATATPRETVLLRIATTDVKAQYDKLREAIKSAKGHLLNADHDGKDPLNIHAQVDFDLRRLSEGEVPAALDGAGELLSRQVNRVPEGDNVTDAKVLYRVTLLDVDSVQPRETITLTIAADDLHAAYQKLHQSLAKAKARIIKTNLDEQDRRKVNAQVDFSFNRTDEGLLDTALKNAGEALSRQVTRLPAGANVTDTKLLARITLIETDSLQPRETVNLTMAADDVKAVYEKLRAAIASAKGRITHADCDEKNLRNVTGALQFDIPRAEEPAIQRELANAGETLSRKVTRQPENINITDTKVGFKLEITPASRIQPRETTVLALEVADVAAALARYELLVKEAKGRTVETQSGQEKNGQVNARVTYDVPFKSAPVLAEKFKPTGKVRIEQVTSDPQAPEGKLALGRLVVTLSSKEMSPRETVNLTIAAGDVKAAFETLRTAIANVKGRTTHVDLNEQDRHNVTAELYFDIPRAEEGAFKQVLANAGEPLSRQVSLQQESINVNDAKVGYRLEIKTAPRSGQEFRLQIRSGLTHSLRGLFISLNYLLLGVLFVLPWLPVALVIFWVGRRIMRRAAARSPVETVATSTPVK